ncbi:MAG: N-acetylmuramoyl-L-alanine amidase [Longicatena sp.]
MKKKKIVLGIFFLCTLLCGSFFVSHMSKVMAHNVFKVLDGVNIVLDAGHGIPDMGAHSNQIKEHDINLRITKKLETLLKNAGAHVVLTRKDMYDLASLKAKNRKKEDMKKRIAIINNDEIDLFVSIHLNSFTNPSARGALAFYKQDSEASKAFANILQKHFKILTNTKLTSKSGDYYILNNTSKVGALVECGFLSNESDRSLLITNSYQEKLAKSLYDSIVEYFRFLN